MKKINHQENAVLKKGFTLIELIAVIAVIAILMGLGAKTLKNITTARGVSTGVPLAESVFAEARAVARGRGVDAYVVIYADTAENDKDMRAKLFRYMGVAVEQQDANGDVDPGQPLQLTGRGTTLPNKVFFNANASGFTGSPNGSALIPGVSGESACYVYRFNSEGIIVDPVSAVDSEPVKFVIQSGVMTPNADKPRSTPKTKRDIGGFAIWKSGQTSVYREADQITTDDSEF